MVAAVETLGHRIRRLIASLHEGEDITVFIRHLPDELHFRGRFLGSTVDLNDREWLDLEIPGEAVMGFEVEHVYDIEQHDTQAALCGT